MYKMVIGRMIISGVNGWNVFWCRCHAKYVALPNKSQYEICATCGNY